MRVACLGNMNNNMFCLVRYLRDRGLDAHLLLLSHEHERYLPEADTYGHGHRAWVRRLGWGSEPDFAKTDPERIRRDLEGFEAFIGCNYAPAFLHKAGLGLDVFCPHGSDYYEVPFYTDERGEPTPLALAQRAAIREAAFYMAPYTNPDRERFWDGIGPTGERSPHPIPLLYLPEYTPERMARYCEPGRDADALRELKRKRGLLVVQHIRQCWANPALVNDHKGNDVLLRGVARYVHDSGGDAGLAIFDYGPDADATRSLVRELGLDDRTLWLAPRTRKEIMPLLALADAAALEFRYSWIAGGGIFEALAMGRPVLARRDDEMYAGRKLFPMLRARDEEQVAEALARCAASPEAMAELGAQGRVWLEQEVINPAVDAVCGMLRSVDSGRNAGKNA
jgi:glycosyltransferase involved in cell wall biosynthesis